MTYPDLTSYGFSPRVVPPSGSGSSRILVCGEAPGEHEDRDLRPFHERAPAGSTFERLLKRAGLSRDQFKLTNVVWQRPPKNWLENAPWETAAVEAWRPHLDALIAEMQPRVIVALGGVALRRFTPFGGKGSTITQVAGYVIPSDYGAWVVPTYHPSFILQGQQELSGAFIYDILRAVEVARDGFAPRPIRYLSHPTLEDALAFERAYDPLRHALSYDIETPKSSRLDEERVEEEDDSYTIVRVSFCFDAAEGYALSMPWQPPYIDVAKRLLASNGAKRSWNGRNFDDPRLKANGCVINGRKHDLMDAWHFLQASLPRSLAFVTRFYGWTHGPWKHLADSEPEHYSCADAHATQLCGDGILRDLERQGMTRAYERHIVELAPILTRMSENGLPYSAERADEFRKELEAKYDERFKSLQTLVPNEVKPVHPKRGYKKVPKDTTGMRLVRVQDAVKVNGRVGIVEVERWARVEPWLPTSWQQVLAYIKFRGHKPPKHRKTDRETTEEDALRKLAKRHKDEVYTLAIECRQLRKVLGTYVNGWKPGADGRIHATPGFWGKMYRISWRRPNIAATIADKKEEYIATGFRKCVTAHEGHVLLESDWNSIEALLVGYFADDPNLMRLARLGVHSFVLSNHPSVSEPADLTRSDDALKELFARLKKAHRKLYDDCKHIIYLSLYGGTPRLAAQLYDLPEARAKEIQNLLWRLFPKVRAWQKRVMEQAHQEAKLRAPYGYQMWFWDVFRWDSKRQQAVLGEGAKSAISFLPRDTAAGILKEALLRLKPLADEGLMLSSTHDAILCEVPESRLDEVAALVRAEMERPIPELNNLVIGVEQKWGRSWSEDEMRILEVNRAAV